MRPHTQCQLFFLVEVEVLQKDEVRYEGESLVSLMYHERSWVKPKGYIKPCSQRDQSEAMQSLKAVH